MKILWSKRPESEEFAFQNGLEIKGHSKRQLIMIRFRFRVRASALRLRAGQAFSCAVCSVLTYAPIGPNCQKTARLLGNCAVPARHPIFVSDGTAEASALPRRFPAVFFEDGLNHPQWPRSQ